MKQCSKCGEEKTLDHYFKDAQKSGGLYSSCKECVNATQRPGRLAAKRRWRRRHPDRVRAYKRRYYDLNHRNPMPPKDPTAPHRAKRAWKRRNPSRVRADGAKRRALELGATPAWANEFFMREAYDLARLRTQATGIRWNVDHVVPLRSKLVCGLHVEFNLAVIPHAENMRKGNRVWPDMPRVAA